MSLSCRVGSDRDGLFWGVVTYVYEILKRNRDFRVNRDERVDYDNHSRSISKETQLHVFRLSLVLNIMRSCDRIFASHVR